jgi:c-di-GMP-binding flagellar brake protein YcgR
MALLETLFKRFRSSSTSRERQARDRYHQLEILQRRHSFIEVKFPRVQQSFQSMILELHADAGYVLIDELYPPHGRQALLEGDSAEISGRSSGVAVAFYSRLLLRDLVDGLPTYRMELPEDIGVSYRRSSYRVYVERETDLQIDIRREDGTALDAGIVNLSADGIKISVQGDVGKLLEQQYRWENCLIRLPAGIDIDCTLEIRNVYPMRTPTLHTLAGGKLEIATAPHRAKLDQYLAAVQRNQRRREVRLS